MADKLVFPIGFDLESGLKEAEVQAKDMQKRLQNAVNNPIKITPLIKEDEVVKSINTISEKMRELSTTWKEMDFSKKFDTDGGLSAEAQELISKYKQLSVVLEENGKTLEKIIALDKKSVEAAAKAAEAEERRIKSIKGIGEGFAEGGATRAVEKQLKKYDELSKRLREIDSLLVHLNAIGEVNGADGKSSERAVSLLNERIELEQQLKSITVTGAELSKQKLKEEEDAQRRLLEIEEKRKNIKGIGAGFDEDGVGTKNLEKSISELDKIEERLREIDFLYSRANANAIAAGRDVSTDKGINDLLRERNELVEKQTRLQTTGAEAAKRQAKEEEAALKRRLALEKQRQSLESKMSNIYGSSIGSKNKQETIKSIAELQRQRAVLSAQENTIANINAKLAVYNKMLKEAAIGSEKFGRITANIERLQERLTEVTGDKKKKEAVIEITEEYGKQSTYISRLIQRSIVYFSFSTVNRFLKQIREVTAQFELQRVSLGAIIQDQSRANALFGEIKQFALKSPITIMDFTKYIKQVAAYRIETDKLFDTTKRLADVSVGLGVDMGRLVLAYGQVKAASYLRAAEIRQFTEAGIPLLELLAEKFTALQGSAVSTEEVMDKVSRRMVSFSMVEDIFNDMTNAGGLFYNMQEKQSQTLYGMWAKLGDAASVMYDEIGNTSAVNSAMKGIISSLQNMALHWTAMTNVVGTAVIGFGVYKAAMAGLIPYYNLQYKSTLNQIKAEKAKKAEMLKAIAVTRELTTQEKLRLKTKNMLTAGDYKQILAEKQLSALQMLSIGRQATKNRQLKYAVIQMGLFNKAQIKTIASMSKWNFLLAKLKISLTVIRNAFFKLGRAMMSFWPVAAITAITDLFVGWRNSVKDTEEAIEKVEKKYRETKVALTEIENAYRSIQKASNDAVSSDEKFAKTSYSQKLAQLQKIQKLLGNFGMKNVIDFSVLDYSNIDDVFDKWMEKLNDVNELTREFGRDFAQIENAYQGTILGWSILGENFKEDMKDMERSWTKLTVNPKFSSSLDTLRAAVGVMSNENEKLYESISNAIGEDLKLALEQKRRNESELEYQQRIYKNYIAIEKRVGAYIKKTYFTKKDYRGLLPTLDATDASKTFDRFNRDVKEVMHEFDKVKERFRGKEALAVRMTIDTMAAEKNWTEWQRDLLIQHLNEDPITLNAEIIPTGDIAGQEAVAQGLKQIIKTEFPDLFDKDQLSSLVSADGIVKAIKTKLDAANESLTQAMNLQNNLVYGSEEFERSIEKIKELQAKITEIEEKREELRQLDEIKGKKTVEQLRRQAALKAELKNMDEKALNSMNAEIRAIVEANGVYDNTIKKQREAAEASRDMAEAALKRVTTMGLSSLGEDVLSQFSDLMVKAGREITDKDYSTDFLISNEDLKKIKDVADLYDVWASNMEGVKKAKEKLSGVGISEATIAEERAKLDEKQIETQKELKAVEDELASAKYKERDIEYKNLKLSLAKATTAKEQEEIQEKLDKFLGDTKNAEYAILQTRKTGLKASIQETLQAQAANDQIADYLKNLANAEDLWKKLGERYNFKLQEKGKGGGEDPWIVLMKNRMKFMRDFQKGVEDLSKWMGEIEGLTKEQENMLGRGLSVKIDSRELKGTREELISWYEDAIKEIQKRIAKLGGKSWSGLGVQMILAKDTTSKVIKKYQELLQEMFKNLTDFRIDKLQKDMEEKLKSMSDEIAKSKEAKNFFDKIFSETKDYDLAMNVTVSVYGDTGGDYKKQIAEQIKYAATQQEGDMFVGLDISGVIDPKTLNVNYKALREAIEKFEATGKTIPEKQKQVLDQILKNGEAFNKSQIEQWTSVLNKNRTFAQRYIDQWRETENEIRAIQANPNLTPETKAEMTQGYQRKRAESEASMEWEMFKDMPLYVQMFADLEHTSSEALGNMKDNLQSLQSLWGTALDPTQLKELQSRMEEINNALAVKNPFKLIGDSIKEYRDARQSLLDESAEMRVSEARTKVEIAESKPGNNSYEVAAAREALAIEESRLAIVNKVNASTTERLHFEDQIAAVIAESQSRELQAKQKLKSAQEEYDRIIEEEQPEDPTNAADVEAYNQKLSDQDKIVKRVQKEYDLARETTKSFQKQADAGKKLKSNINKAVQGLSQLSNGAGEAVSVLTDMKDLLQISSDSAEGIFFDSAVEGLQQFQQIMGVIIGLQTVYNAICESNPWLAIAAAILAMITIITSLIKNERIAAANAEIEEQEKLIKRLEREYDNLSDMKDKVFGGEYLDNYSKRMENLEAQYEASLKKAEAERSKGKQASEDDIESYEDEAYETMQKILEMQNEVAERMMGTSLESAAQSFAESWLDAYLSFSDTAEAMKEKYTEMMKSFVVQNVLANATQAMLQPVYDMVKQAAEDKKITDEEIGEVANLFSQVYQGMDGSLTTLMNALIEKIPELREMFDVSDSLTGISRDIATASEESINGLAVGINTQNFYISRIHANMNMLMESLNTGKLRFNLGTDTIDVLEQHLAYLPTIAQNTAETVSRCERAAVACEETMELLSRVIKPRGTDSMYQMSVNVG